METITAEQAAEAAKGLTFEIVWAALMETRRGLEETRKLIDKTQIQMDKTQIQIDELSRNVGGINNSLGRFTESLFSTGLDEVFNELGYPFTKQGPHVKFKIAGKIVAEVDNFLENGEYAMAVEVKTELKVADVDEHVRRIEVIRRYFDARDDKRILVGAVAGGIVHENVLNYAQKLGLYVVTQKGHSAVVADLPRDFKAREW